MCPDDWLLVSFKNHNILYWIIIVVAHVVCSIIIMMHACVCVCVCVEMGVYKSQMTIEPLDKYKHYITKIVKIGPANSKSFGLHEWKALLVDEWMSFNSTQVYERTKVSSENCKHHSLFKNPFPWIGSTIDHQTDKTNLSQWIRLVQFSHLQCWHC